MQKVIKIGTRGSPLALWQAHHIARELLEKTETASEIVVIETKGDLIIDIPLPKIGGKGLFTAELESALRLGSIDIAVHSLKDLPTEDYGEFVIGAIVARGPSQDILVSKHHHKLSDLAVGAVVGTSSTRRASQLLRARPDLKIIDIRGNVETRINKILYTDQYDATVCAHAGLHRLGLDSAVAEIFADEIMLPAPGQGAIAVQCVAFSWCLASLSTIHDNHAIMTTTAERFFLNELQGGCSKPVAAHAQLSSGLLSLTGRVLSLDGQKCVTVNDTISVETGIDAAIWLGKRLAAQAIEQGALALLQA